MDSEERRASRIVALAFLSGLTGAFAGSVLIQRAGEVDDLAANPLIQAETQQRLAVGYQRAVAEGDVEFATWLGSKLVEP
jgi:hypothetical protein